ncbi:MAG: GH36 C-terminal domain-containing protein [Actinobacteria bacterium]|nr:GH36 C-terminal domain-containing protein [Actinomycetota bacterium]
MRHRWPRDIVHRILPNRSGPACSVVFGRSYGEAGGGVSGRLDQHGLDAEFFGKRRKPALRSGKRFPAFQLGGADRALVAAFRLHGADGSTVLRPRALDPDAHYDVVLLGPDADASDLPSAGRARGADLMMEGLHLKANSPASSWLLSISRTDTA